MEEVGASVLIDGSDTQHLHAFSPDSPGRANHAEFVNYELVSHRGAVDQYAYFRNSL